MAIHKHNLGVTLGGLPSRGQIQLAVIRAGIELRTAGLQFQPSSHSVIEEVVACA